MSESAHPANVARGLSKLSLILFVNFGLITSAEGAISNPNNSDEAKQRAQDRLHQMEESGEAHGHVAHTAQVAQGHKACSISYQPNDVLISKHRLT